MAWPGTYCTDTLCAECPIGYTCAGGIAAPLPAGAGYYVVFPMYGIYIGNNMYATMTYQLSSSEIIYGGYDGSQWTKLMSSKTLVSKVVGGQIFSIDAGVWAAASAEPFGVYRVNQATRPCTCSAGYVSTSTTSTSCAGTASTCTICPAGSSCAGAAANACTSL